MSEVIVIKADTGKLEGLGEKGGRAWAKFRRMVEAMGVGETLRFQWWAPRSPRHHRLFFVKVHRLLDMQEQFDDADKLRQWLTIGAGYAYFAPGPNGRMMAIPESIAWHNMDEADFVDLHKRVDAFLWSTHAQRFLWPHLSEAQAREMVASFMAEFER